MSSVIGQTTPSSIRRSSPSNRFQAVSQAQAPVMTADWKPAHEDPAVTAPADLKINANLKFDV